MNDACDDTRIITDALNYYARALDLQENILHLSDDDLDVAETLAGIGEVYREMDGDNELLENLEINFSNKMFNNHPGGGLIDDRAGDHIGNPLYQSKIQAKDGPVNQNDSTDEKKNLENDTDKASFKFDVPALFRIGNALIVKGQYDSSIKFFSEYLTDTVIQ